MTKHVTIEDEATAPEFPKGWKVFPLKSNSKEPIFKAWPAAATDDPKQIAAWHAEYKNCGWAVATGKSGLAVVDVDGETGEDSLALCEANNDWLPDTLQQKTPHGNHQIFSGDIKPTVSVLGKKIDTRGGNSYIVIEPTIIDGVAYRLNDTHIAPIPAWVVDAAGAGNERIARDPNAVRDRKHDVARFRTKLAEYVKSGHIAIEGQGGDALTYAVAAEGIGLGLSPETVLEEMLVWNKGCKEPWEYDQLQVKVENADRYATAPGADAVAPVHERMSAEALDKLKAASAEAAPQTAPAAAVDEDKYEWCFETYNAAEDANLPPITYRDENKLWPIIPGGSLTQIIAQAKGYKTTFYLCELFRMVAKEIKGPVK